MKAALVAAFALLIFLEVVARVGLVRVSSIERRTAQDYREAMAVRPGAHDAPRSVLMLGNSLLLHALDYDRIKGQLNGQAQVTRFVVENTRYFDWYYGIRRLLASGVRPDILTLSLDAQQSVSNVVRGEYSSYYLYRVGDIPSVARDAGFDLTQASGLVFAHYSLAYAARNNVRNWVLNKTDPAYAELGQFLATGSRAIPPSREQMHIVRERLGRIRQTAAAYGVRFVFVVPPTDAEGGAALMKEASDAGVETIAPVAPGSLGPEYFFDGYHVNDNGTRIFTDALAEKLRSLPPNR